MFRLYRLPLPRLTNPLIKIRVVHLNRLFCRLNWTLHAKANKVIQERVRHDNTPLPARWDSFDRFSYGFRIHV